MDYFQLLNLKKEPFSTSPDPAFFFQSRQHLACLQKLELSIRLRRGLSVVMGEVGTGKTTLSRQLIRQLGDVSDMDVYLVFDPYFETPLDALKAIMGLFDPSKKEMDLKDQDMKEMLKQHLFHHGADQKKNLVMIIDEGQKMPDFFVEILRELLNYETNQYKLLQIVIFAQKEFKNTLDQYPNFADRIALLYPLNPLKFTEMKQMIRFRLKEAGARNGERQFFSAPSLWGIYLKTGGYPRKIIHICHQALLMMIIQSRPRVNYNIVRLCARQSLYSEMGSQGLLSAKKLAFWGSLLLGMALIFVWGQGTHLAKLAQGIPELFLQTDISKAAHEKRPVVKMPEAVTANPNPVTVAVLGKIKVQPGETLGNMIHRIYGVMDQQCFQQVVEANSDIRNPHRIAAGQVIEFPFIQISSPCLSKTFFIEIAEENQLISAYRFIRQFRKTASPCRLIVWQNGEEGIRFSVVVDKVFTGQQAAEQALVQFRKDLYADAYIRSVWPEKAVFGSALCTDDYFIIKDGLSEKTDW